MIDRSGSIGDIPGAEAAEVNGVDGFVTAFEAIGNGQYAGTAFSTSSIANIPGGFQSAALFPSALDLNIGGTGGYTPTGAGITMATANTANDRLSAPNVMFVITDGSPNVPWSDPDISVNYPQDAQGWLIGANAAIDAANAARSAGWIVKAIFVGQPDAGLSEAMADPGQWVADVMTAIGGGDYTSIANFNNLAATLLIASGCPTASIAKTNDAEGPVHSGDTVHYTITVKVAFGPASVTVSDDLPNNFGTPSNFELDGSPFSPTGSDPLVWILNGLTTGTHTLTYDTVVAADTATGDYLNTASITEGPPCGDVCSATSAVSVVIRAQQTCEQLGNCPPTPTPTPTPPRRPRRPRADANSDPDPDAIADG